MGAMKHVASLKKVSLPADTAVDASVDLGPISAGFGIAAKLVVTIPGMDRAQAEALVQAAHQVCPSSNATRDNIDVDLSVA